MSAYLLLGRYGDIMSILPFLKAEADAGEKPLLVLSDEYLPLLEGVSYVEPVGFAGGLGDLRKAFEFAQPKWPGIKSLQVIGTDKDVEEITYVPSGQKTATTNSFVKEMWKLAGKLSLWDDALPLVFDRRDAAREAALVKATLGHKPGKGGRSPKEKPLILVSCDGLSSPFPYAGLLWELIRMRFQKDFQVVALPQAERIYDLLVLYERAHCLVAIDSAPLHLAWACPSLPVLALTNDYPIFWNGSPWMPQWAWCCRYHDFPDRALEMFKVIETCAEFWIQSVIHVWNEYELKNPPKAYHFGNLPVFPGACPRDSRNVLKDSKRMPFLRDCLRLGLQRAKPDEYVCLTRPGVQFTLPPPQREAWFAYRMTRHDGIEKFAPIGDSFCARNSWWRKHLAEIPDFILGNDYHWSEGLRLLFQKHGAADMTGWCYKPA